MRQQNERAYSSFNPNDLIIRDRLALDRTILANERTILSYIRTSLVLGGAGVTLIKLLPDSNLAIGLGYALIPVSVFILIFGYTRFYKITKSLKKLPSKIK